MEKNLEIKISTGSIKEENALEKTAEILPEHKLMFIKFPLIIFLHFFLTLNYLLLRTFISFQC